MSFLEKFIEYSYDLDHEEKGIVIVYQENDEGACQMVTGSGSVNQVSHEDEIFNIMC